MLANYVRGFLLLAISLSYGPRFEKDSRKDRLDLVQKVAASEGQEKSSDLGGTSWQLVRFQGGVDKTLLPDDKTKYTITFGTDGRVTARVDCNTGIGTWKSSAPNKIQFGPLTLTRAMCPPGSLHDQIAEHWGLVRSYRIKDGHLFLSIIADGGIYEFQPIASAASLAGKKWILAEANGRAVNNDRAHIEFDPQSKRFSATGGCNHIVGSYEIDKMHITFSQATTTLIGCKDYEIHRLETDLMSRLREVTDYQIQGDTLRLYVRHRQILTLIASP